MTFEVAAWALRFWPIDGVSSPTALGCTSAIVEVGSESRRRAIEDRELSQKRGVLRHGIPRGASTTAGVIFKLFYLKPNRLAFALLSQEKLLRYRFRSSDLQCTVFLRVLSCPELPRHSTSGPGRSGRETVSKITREKCIQDQNLGIWSWFCKYLCENLRDSKVGCSVAGNCSNRNVNPIVSNGCHSGSFGRGVCFHIAGDEKVVCIQWSSLGSSDQAKKWGRATHTITNEKKLGVWDRIRRMPSEPRCYPHPLSRIC